MGFMNGIWLALLGVLGASNLIIARRPDAKDLIVKLAPYRGWIGALSAVWGALAIVMSVLNFGNATPVYWVTFLCDAALQLVLGLLLGVGVLKTFIKSPEAGAKMDETISRLAPYQGTLGLVALGLGIWMVVASVLFMG